MTPTAELVTTVLAFLTLLAGIATIVIAGLLVVAHFSKTPHGAGRAMLVIAPYALPLAFGVSLVGVVATLYYSEIVGFIPCKLCWIQRIFFYPQVVILAMALFRGARDAVRYLIPLSVVGLIVAIYHYQLQWGGSSIVPCAADGSSDCSVRFFVEFGYITEVMMSLTGFALLLILALVHAYAENRTAN